MQTFLPHLGWNRSLQSLDDLRLGKQRVEAKQILMILAGESQGYQHHPAVQMWAGFERALCMYGASACYQWRIIRDKKCDMYGWFPARDKLYATGQMPWAAEPQRPALPMWLQDPWFMRSHRSNLIRKNPVYYGPKWPNTPKDMPYLWPVNDPSDSQGYRLMVSMADHERLAKKERIMPEALLVKDRIVTVR
jgi:hypothetical protein